MRRVEADLAYTRMEARHYPVAIRKARFEFEHDGVANSVEVLIKPGVAVITGGNGAGKTTLLRGMTATLNAPQDEQRREWPKRIDRVVCSGSSNGNEWEIAAASPSEGSSATFESSTGEVPEQIAYVDPSGDTQGLLSLLGRDANSQDFIEGLDPSALPPDYVGYASRILRRDYEKIEIYEDDSLSEGDEPVPLFSLLSHGIEYGTLEMGRGELSAIYLLWRIWRVPDGTLMIIEEPENHLAAFSQGALMDVLVYLSVERGISFLLSSHSPEMFQRLSDGRVSLVSSTPVPTVLNDKSSTCVAKELGLSMPRSVAAFVEDVAAALVLSSLIRRLDPPLADAVSIFSATEGESLVRKIGSHVETPREANVGRKPIRLVGVLDGDQRELTGSESFEFLPGTSPPESVLRSVSGRWRAGSPELQTADVQDRERLALALARAEGADLHDWLPELAEQYGGMRVTVDVLVSISLCDSLFLADAVDLVNSIRELSVGS